MKQGIAKAAKEQEPKSAFVFTSERGGAPFTRDSFNTLHRRCTLRALSRLPRQQPPRHAFERGLGTAHLVLRNQQAAYEKALDVATITLSRRYAMDFRKPAQRYCALSPPAGIAETIQRFYAAGVRHVILDLLGPYEERDRQIELFAAEGLPLLAGAAGPCAHAG